MDSPLQYTITADGDAWVLTRPDDWPGKREQDPIVTRSTSLVALVSRATHEAQLVARTGRTVTLVHPVERTDDDGNVTSTVEERRWPRSAEPVDGLAVGAEQERVVHEDAEGAPPV